MLYKVTPLLRPPQKKVASDAPLENETGVLNAPGAEGGVSEAPAGESAGPQPRKRRKSAVFDADGHEVLITMMCLKCRQMKPLAMFGLRKMADGAIRNQPWCRQCRSGAGSKKKKELPVEEAHEHGLAVAEGTAAAERPAAGLSAAESTASLELDAAPPVGGSSEAGPERSLSPIEELLGAH